MRLSIMTAATTALMLASTGMTLAAKPVTAGDYFVKSLPGQPEGPLIKMHAG
jgi:carboxypeptidase D